MRRTFLPIVLILFASPSLYATEALIFDGGGYNLYILVGIAERPAIAQVRFTPPGAKDWVHLPREQIEVEKFDMEKHVLIMRFSNKNNPALPPSFSFSVKDKKAVLSISGKRIRSSFDWLEG